MTPSNKAGIKAKMLTSMLVSTWKRIYFSAWNWPNWPVYLKAAKAELKRSVVTVATMAQKNICQESSWFQKEDTSSMENSRPPTGAPNADATPAAAPALMKFLLDKLK